jgi:hypothetical protein
MWLGGQRQAQAPPPDLRERASVLTVQTAEWAPKVDLDGCAENKMCCTHPRGSHPLRVQLVDSHSSTTPSRPSIISTQ